MSRAELSKCATDGPLKGGMPPDILVIFTSKAPPRAVKRFRAVRRIRLGYMAPGWHRGPFLFVSR